MFPLKAGQSWTYRTETLLDDPDAKPRVDKLTIETRPPRQINAQGGLTAWHRRTNNGVDYWLRSDATGVYRVASKGPLDDAPIVDAAPRYVLRQPYQVGTSWEADTTLYVYARRNEFPHELKHQDKYRTLRMSYRIEAVNESVNTPSGSYNGCVRVVGETVIKLFTDATLSMEDVKVTTQESYCPGVGLVRLHRQEHSPTKFIQGGQMLMELVRHRT